MSRKEALVQRRWVSSQRVRGECGAFSKVCDGKAEVLTLADPREHPSAGGTAMAPAQAQMTATTIAW
ncbi:hypothetical protein PR002_g19801 [Phytophthora rubi]|uniref:Uncharacterized protein n=1 Tax=Phytophthora rubi TaxID=129364 RepID=A0A6A3JIU3_9STRA|nr:hypothetical protein PR002_g19801 [Phytophthora rubi]